MRKILSLITVVAVISGCTACKQNYEIVSEIGDPTQVTGVEYVEKTQDTNNEATEIGEETVHIYVPRDYMYSGIQSFTDDAKSKGATDIVVYQDGSVSYKMPRSKYDEMMESNRTAFEESIPKMAGEYRSVIDVKYTEDFSHFDFYVDAEAYVESSSTLLQETLYAGSKMYQMYMGKDPATIKMTYKVIDHSNGKIVEKATFPDDMQH